MTNDERVQVEKLRKHGVGFAEIAERVGLSENTVKSHCRRAGVEPEAAREGVCPHCGKPLPTSTTGRPRRFCCRTCNNAWWYVHARELGRKNTKMIVCAACGKSFAARTSAARKYCSHPCFVAARRGALGALPRNHREKSS